MIVGKLKGGKMELKLVDTRMKQYSTMLRTAQDLEMSIGSTQYRIYKLSKMREEIDIESKKWWDEILKEYSLDPNKDYMITPDGSIRDIVKEKDKTFVKPEEVKPEDNKKAGISVSDLK